MAGLLAWAADVVGGGAAGEHHPGSGGGDGDSSIPLIFTPEQLNYVQELDRKASSLSRSIQDLRLRLSPPDISQRLPDLHAHSLASNAALALQLSAHSSTKEQAQLREIKLQEENAECERAIFACENKIQDKLQELKLLQNKLKELDEAEKTLENELENVGAINISSEFEHSKNVLGKNETSKGSQDSEDAIPALLEKLEYKKQELTSIEERVQDLEKRWAAVQENALTQPSPAQREKTLDKQLHGLIEQLESKQAQAENLVNEIHKKETDLESLNGRSRALETSITDANAARNRFGKGNNNSSSSSLQGYNSSSSSGYIVDPHYKGQGNNIVGKSDNLQRLMLFRSAFVLYILALHVLVFIKISF